MISCTEFIPSYSELFSFIDENFGGHKEVERFWQYLFEPTEEGIPLIKYAKKDGLKGCFDYWTKTLSEEAASTTRYLNEEKGFVYEIMDYCPSKGRLLQYQKEIGLVPYYDYCGHCDYYRSHLEKVGLTWISNFVGVDKAQCSYLIIDPKKFKGVVSIDEKTVKSQFIAEEAEYFHPDFHNSLNMGIDYLGENYGVDNLKAYFKRFVKNYYVKTVKDAENNPFLAIANRIKDTYKAEKALDVISFDLQKDRLNVNVEYCPAIKHLKSIGSTVSKYFIYSTTALLESLANEVGVKFKLNFYEEETGKSNYYFYK